MKGHWWFLTLFWPNDDQEMFSTAHDVFKDLYVLAVSDLDDPKE